MVGFLLFDFLFLRIIVEFAEFIQSDPVLVSVSADIRGRPREDTESTEALLCHPAFDTGGVCVLSSVSKDCRDPVVPPGPAVLHVLPDGVEPVPDALGLPQVDLALELDAQADCQVAALVQQ